MNGATPIHWRQIRLIEEHPGKFNIVTFYVYHPFSVRDKVSLGLPADLPTDGLELEVAIENGEQIERRLEGFAAGHTKAQRLSRN